MKIRLLYYIIYYIIPYVPIKKQRLITKRNLDLNLRVNICLKAKHTTPLITKEREWVHFLAYVKRFTSVYEKNKQNDSKIQKINKFLYSNSSVTEFQCTVCTLEAQRTSFDELFNCIKFRITLMFEIMQVRYFYKMLRKQAWNYNWLVSIFLKFQYS